MDYVWYFLSLKRTYLAIVLIGTCVVQYAKGEDGGLYLFIAFFVVLSEMLYLVIPAKWYVTWWQADSKAKGSQDRMKRVVNEQLTCERICKRTKTGYYIGRDGELYKTTLKKCTCYDFKKRGKTCKHMYHLAQELGAIEIEWAKK